MIPWICVVVFVTLKKPVVLVFAGALAQAILLPVLGLATLFFRYRRCDARTKPGRLWDTLLWLSVIGLMITGGYTLWDKGTEAAGKLSKALPAMMGSESP